MCFTCMSMLNFKLINRIYLKVFYDFEKEAQSTSHKSLRKYLLVVSLGRYSILNSKLNLDFQEISCLFYHTKYINNTNHISFPLTKTSELNKIFKK